MNAAAYKTSLETAQTRIATLEAERDGYREQAVALLVRFNQAHKQLRELDEATVMIDRLRAELRDVKTQRDSLGKAYDRLVERLA